MRRSSVTRVIAVSGHPELADEALTPPALAMTTGNTTSAKPVCALLNNYSIEMTAKDIPHLEAAANIIPQGTKIPVTFLPGETFEMRIAAAKRVRDLGFLPIPHISARRLQSL